VERLSLGAGPSGASGAVPGAAAMHCIESKQAWMGRVPAWMEWAVLMRNWKIAVAVGLFFVSVWRSLLPE